MKDLFQMLGLFEGSVRGAIHGPTAVATIVRVEGSSYRKSGARMLIEQDTIVCGSITGGCLEKDIVLRSHSVIQKGKAEIVRYDSMKDSDDVMGLGLGCRGVIDVLIEPVSSSMRDIEFSFLNSALKEREPCVIAKVIRTTSATFLKLGTLFLVTKDDSVTMQSDSKLREPLLDDARKALLEKQSFCAEYQDIDVFYEFLPPLTSVIVYGSGPGVAPLLRLGKEMGFEIQAMDGVVDEVAGLVSTDRRDPVVVMTHNYFKDLELVKALLFHSQVSYIGLLSSKRRFQRLLDDISSERPLSDDELRRIYSPIGLDIGAESPEEIALAIISEILSVTQERSSGFLRDSRASNTGVIILAAGLATRMGRLKQAMKVQGKSFLMRAVETAIESKLGPVVVVLGARADELRPELTGLPVYVVSNHNWDLGMGSSIATGIKFLDSISPPVEGALVMLCDQPKLDANILTRFTLRRGKLASASFYKDTRGVPALFDRRLFPKLIEMDPATGAKKILSELGDRVDLISVPEAAVDIDTPEDLENFLRCNE
jgi:xanthine dehydrogenase accessory factor